MTYTRLLLEAIPVPDPAVKPPQSVRVGEPPSPLPPPSGCASAYAAHADQWCAEVTPELREIATGRQVACHHPLIAA
jgi:peptide/nickel transport system ATP-binding protein